MNIEMTLANGKINAMIYNPLYSKGEYDKKAILDFRKPNELLETIEIFLLEKVDSNGNVLETLREEKIAQSPILHPGEKIDYLPILDKVELEPGNYSVKVCYTAYKMVEEDIIKVGQILGRASLKVDSNN